MNQLTVIESHLGNQKNIFIGTVLVETLNIAVHNIIEFAMAEVLNASFIFWPFSFPPENSVWIPVEQNDGPYNIKYVQRIV